MSQPPPGAGPPDGERTTRLPHVGPPSYPPPPPAQRHAPPAATHGYAPHPGYPGPSAPSGPPGPGAPPSRSGPPPGPGSRGGLKRRIALDRATPGTHEGWRALLFTAAVVVALLALITFLLALFDHSTVTQSATASTRTTSTRSAPTFAMAGAVGAAALVLVLAAAFFERITKISFAGMEFDLDSVKAAVRASEAAGGDEATREANVKRALARLAVAEPAEKARLIAQPTQLAAELSFPPPG